MATSTDSCIRAAIVIIYMLETSAKAQLIMLVAQNTCNLGHNGNQHRHMHLNYYHYSLYVGVWFLMYAWSIIHMSIAYTGSPEH
jgi:hypothetical protein